MSIPQKLNDAPILDQLDGHWQKLATLLVHKLTKRGEEIVISAAEMKRMEMDWPAGAILFVHGRHDSIALKLVTPEEAARIAEYQSKQGGTA